MVVFAQYSYLHSCLFCLKVFEDVVEILDPEMNIDSENGEDEIQVKSVVNCNIIVRY